MCAEGLRRRMGHGAVGPAGHGVVGPAEHGAVGPAGLDGSSGTDSAAVNYSWNRAALQVIAAVNTGWNGGGIGRVGPGVLVRGGQAGGLWLTPCPGGLVGSSRSGSGDGHEGGGDGVGELHIW